MNERALRTLEFDRIRALLTARAQTAAGKAICAALQPSPDPLEVAHRLRETSEARALLDRGAGLNLGGVRDLRQAVRRAILGAPLEPAELLDVADTAAAARRLRRQLAEHQATAPTLAAYGAQLGDFAATEAEIRRSITEEGEVADAASPELARIRREMRILQNRIRERLETLVRNPSMRLYLQEPIVTIRDDRYVLPVKVEYRSQVPGVVHDQSQSGSTLFIEPFAVVDLGNDLKRLALDEREEIARILARLTGLIAQDADAWTTTLEALAHLDFCAAKALLSRDLDAVEPVLSDRPEVAIVRGRHPLLPVEPVPIDVHLGRDFDVLVITGPNTGGKTVTLKTIGLFCLMAQAGLHVPAAPGTELGVFSQVFADIGDEQSIEASLSTFSSHMGAIAGILAELQPGALVLLDELGAGTDPTEGAALAMAILEHLQARGALAVATTHYPELKAFAFHRDRVENASVEFDLETLRPTYRLQIGTPGASQAFEIALRLGIAPSLVERARSFLSREEDTVERLLAHVQAARIEAEREREAARAARAEAERLQRDARERLARTREREQEILEKARAEAASLLAAVRREAEEILDELRAARRQQAAREQERAIAAARERLRALSGRTRSLEPAADAAGPAAVDPLAGSPEAGPPPDLRPGETVYVRSMNVTATVLSPPDVEGQVTVQAGVLKLRVPVSDLLRAAAPAPAAPPAPAPARPRPEAAGVRAGFSTELDLRGLTTADALRRIDKYLDDALLAGATHVRIIHGKGTGALRQAVQRYLREHPAVVSFRLGGVGEGGDGVTVATLQEP
ncbi:endonuclease MutS2 [Caldinitratiruptor microaerophilus]|uniref:Endonuclease MutS2 n=1 Tax=Caldinitratiruptor microaerophilus TaxID=671077 RepID=A0AA35CK70_9FIRM|nr:endonuclease MutS2 [Caldinitratiruptor microaerophilus]BDG60824.1 endonuclease MutS2 [Caldinitratiruptor microaerophilus]